MSPAQHLLAGPAHAPLGACPKTGSVPGRLESENTDTVRAHLGLDVHQPAQDLLVGQAVQGARQAVEPSGEGVVGVAQRGTHQVRRVRAHVAALRFAENG